MDEDLKWFAERGHWVIRKVPNTKDDYYVACGYPSVAALAAYGIEKDPLVEDIERQIIDNWLSHGHQPL